MQTMNLPLALCLGLLAACTDDVAPPSSGDEKDATDETENEEEEEEVDPDSAGDSIGDAAAAKDFDTLTSWGDPLAYGAIDTPGDSDFFSIQTAEGFDYLIATAAYIYTGDGIPDTVIRLYDQDGNLLLTNDDMPFRFWETDSAIWFQAEYDGTYYVEVMEFSDWAESDDGAEGGEAYTYELWGTKTYYTESEAIGSNNTQEEADELYEAIIADEETGMYYSSWFDGYLDDSNAQFITNIYGHINEEGDKDIWRFDVDYTDDDDDWGWMTWSAFDSADAEFTPRMSLYSADWELLATSTDLAYTAEYYAIYDTGLAYPAQTGTYYLVMEDDAGYGGPGAFYAINRLSWLGSLAQQETEGNDGPSASNILEMTESTGTAGWYYARATGNIGSDDPMDCYQVSADDVGGSLEGKYLNLQLQSQGVGSFLDAVIRVQDASSLEVLAEVSATDGVEGGDPHVVNLQIAGETSGVYITVEPETVGEVELSNYYLFMVSISEEEE
jgi:hypothetical protein